jgi:MFS superfamily sulfate permease-like transporter
MSDNRNRTAHTVPRTERWIIVMACAFLPMLAALVAPEVARIPLVALAGLVFLIGFVLMVSQSRRSRDDESLRQLVHAERE